ncbi:MAG: NAD(P)H-hydrate dehydratase, partial [Rubrobacteraceae bacterium]
TPASAAPDVDLRLTEALVYGMPKDDSGQMTSEALDQIVDQAERATAIVIGPGMGTGEEGTKLVEGILQGVEIPVLLDADAISNLSGSDAISQRQAPTVITPHPGELGRLMESGTKELQARRLRSAWEASEKHGCCVLLKGSDTIVTEGGRTAVNSTGGVALATAGTGDVLSGVIGSLLSRGMEPYEAARAGAWVHGRAAELWLEETSLPSESFIATDLLAYIPKAMREVL